MLTHMVLADDIAQIILVSSFDQAISRINQNELEFETMVPRANLGQNKAKTQALLHLDGHAGYQQGAITLLELSPHGVSVSRTTSATRCRTTARGKPNLRHG